LGNKEFSQKNYTEAIKKFTQSIELHPTEMTYSNRAAAYIA